MTLTPEEEKRYARHVALSEVGREGQLKLKQAKVLVIGAGGLGCPVLQYLAAAGVGTIGIVDHDMVDVSNLQRQILFSRQDVGKNKAEVAREKLLLQNPEVKINAISEKLTSANALKIIGDYDLVVDGTDNFPTRYLSNDACVMLNKPLVFGSIFKFEGQVSVFNFNGGPTYRCLFPQPPAQAPNCSEVGVMGVLPGMIGTIMAAEAIKVIVGLKGVLSGKLILINALNMQFNTLDFERQAGNEKIEKLIDYDLFCAAKSNSVKDEITVDELRRMMDAKEDFQLVDVREVSEYQQRNLKGENIPLARVGAEHSRISRSRKVVVHCKSGRRSRNAIELLRSKFGYTNLLNLAGGIDAWK